MDYIYREQFRAAGNFLDRYNRLRPSAILDMMQQVATNQCRDLAMDWDTMASKGLFWAVTRQHIQILGHPRPGSTITIETWPGITTRVAYPRSTVGYDENGKEFFRAISLWVLMDLQGRSLVLPKKSGIEFSGIARGGELPVPASLGPVKLAGTLNRRVVYSELDINGHMSNTRYLDWMADLLPGSFHEGHPIREFTVSYLSEAREGEEITLNYELSPEGALRLEATEEKSGHRVFAVSALYEG